MGMQHVTTLPGLAATRLVELTNLQDSTHITAAVSRTTRHSPMTPYADVLVMRATAATVAMSTTVTTEMTMDAAPTMGPTTTPATISHNCAAVPSVPSPTQVYVPLATMVGSMMAASQQTANVSQSQTYLHSYTDKNDTVGLSRMTRGLHQAP